MQLDITASGKTNSTFAVQVYFMFYDDGSLARLSFVVITFNKYAGY